MSYSMTVLFRCDGCGLEHKADNLCCPVGWLEPGGLGQQRGPHLCGDCVSRRLSQPSNLVPVERADELLEGASRRQNGD